MARFIGIRLLQAIVVVVIVTFATYWMQTQLGGDPCVIATGGLTTEERVAECRQERRLDENILSQYGHWAGSVLQGDLGESYSNGISVTESLSNRMPPTLSLFIYSQLIALMVALPLGILAAYRQGGPLDRLISMEAFVFLSLPVFVLGELARYFFAVKLGWYDLVGYVGITEDLAGHVKSIWLPALVLGLVISPVYLRLLRTDMTQNLQQDYVSVAKAKGMPTRSILLRHVLRPSTLTLFTVAGLQVAQLVNGAIVVEFTYDLDGMGSFLIEKLVAREFFVVQTIVALVAILFVVVNLLIDIIYGIVDPRVRVQRSGGR